MQKEDEMNEYGLKIQTAHIRKQADTEKILLLAKASGITTLDVNLHQGGAHYIGDMFPISSNVERGFDPLGYILQRGHELDMTVYVWLCPGAFWQTYPQWDIFGKHNTCPKHWYDMSVPEARQKMADITLDIYAHYPSVDGFSLDYIRYTDASKTADYPAWWPGMPGTGLAISDITTTVQIVKDAVAGRGGIRAHVRYGDWLAVFQDWPTWIRTDLMDYVMPMMYADTNNPILGAHSINSWLTRYEEPLANGQNPISRDRMQPCLSLNNLHVTPEAPKTTGQLQIEINDARTLGYNNLQYFDSKALLATPSFAAFLAQENFQEEEEPPYMAIKIGLLKVADDLDAQTVVLQAKSDGLDDKIDEMDVLNQEMKAEIAKLSAQALIVRDLAAQLEVADKAADDLAELI
jgi:hypothetical protein